MLGRESLDSPIDLQETPRDYARQSTFLKRRRVKSLWAHAKQKALAIGRFNKLNSEIKKFGTTRISVNTHDCAQTTEIAATQMTNCVLSPVSTFKKIWDGTTIILML